MIKQKMLIPFMGLLFGTIAVEAQQLYTIDNTLQVAYQNSPDIRRQELSLERSRESLKAQRAALKSRFALDVNPFSYSNERQYSPDFQEWRTYKNLSSSGTFSIAQPIKATDGTVTLTNNFGYRSSTLNDNDAVNSFYNNLRIRFDQPIFTYNRTKLELRELELDLENTLLTYAIQKLNV
jgi:outer membrane protein TolC